MGSGSSFKLRVLTAAVGIPLIIVILLTPTPVMLAAVVLCALIGTFEFYAASGLLRRQKPLCILGFIGTALIPFCTYFEPIEVMTGAFVYLVLLFVTMLICHRSAEITDLSLLIMGLVYIPLLLSNLLFIRRLEFGKILAWLVFVGSFVTDSGAFFAGKLFGRHKLCPEISPKKTVEGAVGGTVACGLGFLLFALIVNLFFSDAINAEMSYGPTFLLGILASLAAQVGDLIASLIKRKFGIKDYGKMFPGHGGMLDRCDSILLVAPVIYLFVSQVSLFF